MKLSDRVIMTIPLQFIWTEQKELESKRIAPLTNDGIRQLLKKSTVQFIIANVGDKLQWIDRELSFNFWKNEVKQHVADNLTEIDLDDFIDNYAYVASSWTTQTQQDIPIILLEKYH